MRWSNTFIPTLRQIPQEAETISHQLMLRAGFTRMLVAGVYSYLPLGLRVLNNIENIVRQEMNACAAAELLLPALQPLELWQRSGRDKDMGEVMVRFEDRRGRHICLGPTHEEVITDLVKSHVSSYKQLPLILFQIQTKFRDEIRPRFGLIRACEFIMKDAYSFDRDEEGLDKNYRAMYDAYKRIFTRCGLEYYCIEADSGVMGGKLSHEFMVAAKEGEDVVLACPRCKGPDGFSKDSTLKNCPKCQNSLEAINTLEVGHIFKLGTKYSSALEANFLDAEGKLQPIIMGCYGIGVSRLICAIIEQNNDANGIIWPDEISPYKACILPLDATDKDIMDKASGVYQELERENIPVLLDDRNERAGVKFKDADLLGITLQVIIGRESIKNNTIELKVRRTQEKIVASKSEVLNKIKELAKR
jgi:prolyl-tRNA synthetase